MSLRIKNKVNMSEIYEIRERGQVVTEGCQWIVTHRRLAMQLAVKPVLILAIIELANILFLQSIAFSLIIAFIALLLDDDVCGRAPGGIRLP